MGIGDITYVEKQKRGKYKVAVATPEEPINKELSKQRWKENLWMLLGVIIVWILIVLYLAYFQ